MKKPSLSSVLREKPPEQTPQEQPRPQKKAEVLLGIMVRPEQKLALKELQLALQKERGYSVSTKDLITEALNDVMKKYHKPEVFPSRRGEGSS